MFYGWVAGDGDSLKYFSLSELESTLVNNLPLQRDLSFQEITLNELREKLKRLKSR